MFSHLRRINTFFYFRLRVPSDLKQVLGRREIQKTLRTTNPKAARTEVKSLAGKAEEMFRLIRSGVLTPDQIAEHVESQFPSKKARGSEENPKHLSEVMSAYVQEHVLLGKWTDKTKMEVEGCLSVFSQLVGNPPVRNLNRKVMVDFLEKVSRLPANMNKKPEYRGKTVLQLLEMQGIEPMSPVTVNKHLSRAGALMIYCVRQGYLDRNPAEGLSIARNVREEDERSAYTADDLTKLLPCIGEYKVIAPERYFVPLIGMLSGARLNEICQLYMEDVKEIDGILCFDINDEKDKRLKTLSSRRIIPVHPRLAELGLLKYVEHLRESGSERLWPNLDCGRDGYSHRFGKWYQRHNRKHITTDPKKCFHSFRHTVADTLKQAGVAEGIIGEILGHSNGSITTGRYGKRFRPGVLLEALRQLSY